MKKHVLVTAVIFVMSLLVSRAQSDVRFEIKDTTLCYGASLDTIHVFMENLEDTVAGVQIDVLFDTDCWTIIDVEETDRSYFLDIFTYSEIPGGIRIAMTSPGLYIYPGRGSIAAILVDGSDCGDEGYPWDVTNSMAANQRGESLDIKEEDGHIGIAHCDPILEVSTTNITLGDVLVGWGWMRSADVTVRNVGSAGVDVSLIAGGCSQVYPTAFYLDPGSSMEFEISCRPEQVGLCEGTVEVHGGMDVIEISVSCNGVVPAAAKGDVNQDGVINVLDAMTAVYCFTSTIHFTNETYWLADCNGPLGNCDGDQIVDVLDVVKIVNLILQIDECP